MKKLLRYSFYLLLFCLPIRSFAQLFPPVIVPLPTAFPAFTTTSGTASASQSSAIIGVFIDGAGVTATAPAGFEVSTDGVTFAASVNFAQNAVLNGTTLYARLKASDPAGSYSGTITLKDGSSTSTITIASSTVNPPPPALSSSGTPTSVTTTFNVASPPTTFQVSGTNLLAGILVTPPTGFEVSSDGGTTYHNTVTVGSSGVTVGPFTIDIRLKNTDATGTYSGNIVLSSTSATPVNVAMPASTVTPLPTITASTASGTMTTAKGTPSTPATFTVSGANMNAGVLMTAPAGFEISVDGGTTYNSTATTGAAGNFGANTIDVRLTGTNAGTFSGNIVLTSPGAADVDVAVSGTVSTNPVITASTATVAALTTPVGTASTTDNFDVSGTNINADGVLVTPPTGFEVSTDGTNFSPTVTIPQGTGNFTNTPIYVRLLASDAVGTYSGNIALTSSGTAEVDVAITASTVTPLLATVTTTSPASNITGTGAGLQGNVSADGGGTVTEKGIAYGTAANPTIAVAKVANGSGLGAISVNITGLSNATVYHYRAYATNITGTAYGTDETFTTLSPPTITSFSPSTGPVGTLVTISGTDLSSQIGVVIGGVNAVVISDDGSTIVAMVMPGATTGAVQIATLGGSATSVSNFTVTPTQYPLGQKQTKLVGTGAIGAAGQGGIVGVSADGNTAVVSGPDDNSEVGALWVYTRSGGVWSQQGTKLIGTGSTGTSEQGFSAAISADGNTIVEGGPFDNSSAGAVWVFTRSGGTWTQQGSKVTASDETGAAELGTSISVSADGNTMAVGGYNDASSTGAVWVFTRSGGVWSQQGSKLVGAGTSGSGGLQGYAVAISADASTIAEGGRSDDGSNGSVWVFTQSGGVWSQQGSKLQGSGLSASQEGFSVALSADGNTLATGGPYDNSGQGAAWIFTRSGATWTEQRKLIGTGNTGPATQGSSIALSADGNTMVMGGPQDNSNIGASWAFTRSGVNWSQQHDKFHAYEATGAATQGNTIAISADGTTAFVGGEVDNSAVGAAWPYIVLIPPTTQAINVAFSNVNPTTADVSWTNGDGLLRAVFIAQANSGSPLPVDFTQYNANLAFGSGDQIGSTGWYCIYNGVGSGAVTVTGLTPNTTYRVMTVEYNGTFTDVNYLTTTSTNNPENTTTPGPVISTTGTPGALTTTYGTASTSTQFNVSGTLMEAGILVTAPSGFEVSTDNTTFSSTVTVGAAGTIGSTPVYVRLAATTPVGTYTGNVVLTSTDATTVNVATTSSSVTVATLTLTANDVHKTYGTTLTNVTGSAVFTPSGLQNGETVGTVDITYGIHAAATSPFGPHSGNVTASNASGGTFNPANYTIVYHDGTIWVDAANLTITASTANKTYGTTLTSGSSSTGFTSTGLQNGETIPSVTLTYGTGSLGAGAVGTYTNQVTPSAAAADAPGLPPNFQPTNYNITYDPGDIVVGQAALTITANTANKTYGATLTTGAGSSAFTPTGLQNGESIGSATLTYGTGAAATDAVGTYTNQATPSAAVGGTFTASNYLISYTSGDIVIGAAPLTITANTANKNYGATLTGAAGLTAFTPSGLQNGETVGSVTLAYGTGAAATDAVATYSNQVTASAAVGGTFTAANYIISYHTGDIVVGAAPLTVTANTANKTYGTMLIDNNGLTAFTPAGLQNGETIGSVTIAYGTGAAANAAVGTYSNQATPSAAIGGTFTASNYTISYNPGDIVIGAAPLTITANTANKTYGATLAGAAGSAAFIPSGLQNGETVGSVTVAYGTGSAATDAVGTYTNQATPSAAVGGTFTASNYLISYTSGDIVIAAAPLIITATTANKTYGATLTGAAGLTAFTPSGLQNGESVGSVTLAYGSGSAATDAVGTYSNQVTSSSATGGTFTASNYSISYHTGDIVIGVATLTVTANTANKTYGTTLTGGTGSTAFTPTGLQNGESIGGVTIAYGTGAAAADAVGTYSNQVTPSVATGGTFTASNYTISYNPGDIVIGAAPLTITASDVSKTYGSTITGAAGSSAFTPGGLQNGETVGTVTIAYGTGSAATDAAGTYTNQVVPSAAIGGTFTASNYNITYNDGTITIDKANLTIAGNDVSKNYGTTLTGGAGSAAFTPTGLQNGESISSVTITYGTGAAATDAVGTYTNHVVPSAATGGTANLTNYNVSYGDGTITVNQTALSITANTANKTYGTTLTGGSGSSAFTPTGLQNGESIGTVTIAYGTGAAATDAVGTYSNQVTPSAAIGGTFTASNYIIAYNTGDIMIGAAALTVAAKTANKTYGTVLTGGTGLTAFTPTGLQNGENIGSVTLAYGTGAAATDAVGTYTNQVTPSAAVGGTFTASNYLISYTKGDIVIAVAPLTITANTANKTYGTTLTGAAGLIAFTPAGLQNGETVASVTLAYGTGAAATDAVGTYTNQLTPTAAVGGTFTASNYTITYTKGDIVIAAAPLTIAATTVNKTYGTVLTGGTGSAAFTPTGLQNGESVGSVTIAYGTGAAATDAVGTYSNQVTPSAPTGGSFTASNYNISYTNADIIIGTMPISVTANAQTKVYGDVDPTFNVTINSGSLVGTDNFSGALTRVAGENVGTYAISQGTLTLGSNYSLTFTGNNLTITAKPITATADALSKFYGNADPAPLTYTVTGTLVGTDSFSGALIRAVGENAGTYAITQNTLALSSNYQLTFNPGIFTINQRALTITANDAGKVYGQTLISGAGSTAYTITSGTLNAGETIGSITMTYGTGASATDPVSSYPLQAIPSLATGGTFNPANYDITYIKGAINVTVATLNITANTANKNYGQLLSDVTGSTDFSQTGLQNGESIGSVSITYGTGAAVTAHKATYTGTALPSLATGGTFNPANYDIHYNGGDIVVGQATLTITALPVSKVYGQTLNGITGSTSFSQTGLVNSESIGSVTMNYGTGSSANDPVATYSLQVVASSPVGGTFTAGDYDIHFVNGDLTVTPEPITATADVQTKVYGDADPALTVTVTSGALVGTDHLTGSLTRIGGETIGDYAINQGTLAASANYTLSYVSKNLTIVPKAITVTADALTKIYGDADPTLTYAITTGALVGTDNFSGTLGRTTGENVGTYPINQGSLALSSNYILSFTTNTFTITKKPVTITADAINKNYGDTDPTLTYTYPVGALVGSDAFSGALARTAGETVGAYPINIGTLTLGGNYTLGFSANNLTINARPITITADVKTKVYGTTDPALTYAITSGNLVNGDLFTGVLNRIAGENVGAYTINQGTVALNSNYLITYNSNNLNITVRAIAIKADAQSKVYGATDPTLTYAITIGALVSGDNFTGTPNRTAGENVGTYAINQGTLALNSNYTLSYSGDNLTITKANITVTANNASKVYGTALGTVNNSTAFTSTGLQNGESIGNVTINYGAGGAASDAVGVYTGSVTASAPAGGSFNPGNYTIGYTAADLTVAKGSITITANNVSKTYGTVLSNTSGSTAFTTTGLQNGETIGTISTIYGAGANATDPVGTYSLAVAASLPTGGTFNPANYDINYTNGNIIIGTVAITLTANPVSKIYGSTLTAGSGSTGFALTAGAMQNGDLIGSVSVSYGTGSAATATVGSYNNSVTISGATGGSFTAANYSITYLPSTITVTRAPITVKANNTTKTYGQILTGGSSTAISISSGSLKNGETIGSITLAYGTGAAANAPAGTYTGSVTPSAATGGSFAINNYTVSYANGDIIVGKAALTLVATGVNKVYDGTTAATVTTADNRIPGDNVIFNYISTFSDKNVGNGKAVTVNSITIGGPSANNYTVNATATTTANITKTTATVTAQTATKTYDKTIVTIVTPSVGGLMTGDFVSSPPTETYDNANTGTNKTLTAAGLIINDGNSGNNYNINYVNNTTGVVTPRAVTVTAQTDSKQYNGTTASAGVPLTGSLLAGDIITTAAKQAFANANVGNSKAIVPSGLVISDGNGGANYTVNYVNNISGIITPATLTFTANTVTKTYGAATPALTGTITGFVAGDTQTSATTGAVVFTTAATPASPVGNYLVAGGGLSATNYVFTQAPLNNTALAITKAPVTITANSQTKVYGAANPVFTASYAGLVNGDTPASMATQPVILSTGASTSGVGTYPITVAGASSNNYNISYAGGTLTVTPAQLTVIANNESRKYGATNPALLVNYTGFVNGDNTASLTSQAGASTTATITSAPGKYPITASGASSLNYTIAYQDGTLTVQASTNSALNDLTVSTGVLSPAFNSAVTSYVVNVGNPVTIENVTPSTGDATATITVNGKAVVSGTLSQNIPLVVGLNTISVVVTAQDGVTKTTYIITVVRAAPLPATINVAGILPSKTTIYGTHSTSASFTVSASNAAAGLTITSPAGFEVSANNTTFSKTIVVGSAGTINPTLVYIRIAATTQVGTYAGNIAINATNGSTSIVMPSSTVTPTPLLITADDKTRNPGTANPYLTLQYEGFVNGDNPSDLTTQPTVTTTAQTNSPIGTYPITVSGAVSSNYTITYKNGTLTITPLAITNSFTPNGDGVNDTWQIPGLKDYPNCTVSIFTRTGVRVFYSVRYPVAWDGRIDGKDLPAGTYYYVIDLKNDSKPMSGWVAVIR